MRRATIISLIIAILLASALLILTINPMTSESSIRDEIEKARYCNTASDCVDAGGKCPFGCYAYVNKNEVDRIAKLISSFEIECAYDCVLCQTAICEDNKCKEVCDS